jgi:hypothetical protein
MEYLIKKNDRIIIKGKPDEIRDWVKEICTFMDKGASYSMLGEDMDNLEHIVEPVQFTFGIYHRIYYNNNTLLYVPNVSTKEAKKFHYKMFEKMFDEARKKIDTKYVSKKKNK